MVRDWIWSWICAFIHRHDIKVHSRARPKPSLEGIRTDAFEMYFAHTMQSKQCFNGELRPKSCYITSIVVYCSNFIAERMPKNTRKQRAQAEQDKTQCLRQNEVTIGFGCFFGSLCLNIVFGVLILFNTSFCLLDLHVAHQTPLISYIFIYIYILFNIFLAQLHSFQVLYDGFCRVLEPLCFRL